VKDGVLTLDLGRDERKLKVAFFEGEETTLRPYEIHEPEWRQIEKSCREILFALDRSNRSTRPGLDVINGLKKSGHLLFDFLLPPKAKEKLANTTAKILTLRLDDTLVHISWELLFDGREFLCRRFATGRIASTRQTPTARSIRAPVAPFKVLILADPRGDLRASYREGVEIKDFLDGRKDLFHVDFKSYPVDIAFVKKHLRDYDIVHYAGHAKYSTENPSESGWLLSDGTLTAAEIAALGGLQPMPALVFANACQSGETEAWKLDDGQAEQTFGLVNAFLLSGVKHYVGTFREIVDDPSSKFAKPFYTSIANGESIGTAIRNAREVNGGENALAWANYMLYGDPSRELGDTENRNASQKEWKGREQLFQWRTPIPGRKESARNFPLYFSLIAVLLLASIYTGYSQFYPAVSKPKANPPPSPVAQLGLGVKLTPTVPPQIKAPLGLSMNIIGQRKEADGSYTEVIVREGGVLRSGDGFQVHVETDRASHVHVLLFDSSGSASQLFPDPKIHQPGFVEGAHKMAIPDKDLWFWLDESPGTETVYVLASEEPMTDIRGLLGKMAKASEAERKRLSGEIKQRLKIVERGVGGVAKGKTTSYPLSDGRLVQKVTEIVSGTGAVVRAISFRHD
jgi:CHAT domain-containing protein